MGGPSHRREWSFGAEHLLSADIRSVGADAVTALPYVLRILLENVLRQGDEDERTQVLHAMRDWLRHGHSSCEVLFRPARLLMHDTTCGPALADIAALRSELTEAGKDPRLLNPALPIDVSTDHSIGVDHFAEPNALRLNMAAEMARNGERYGLMKWASQALKGMTIHPPGTGIMHTINLEQLATVATRETSGRLRWAYPDTVLGTDSHTPMINGLGVLAWGIGGLEAEGIMFGVPTSLRIPDVVGVRLTGTLPSGVFATDLALRVTEELRKHDLAETFVEFCGHGVSTLSVFERVVIANMAPEYGAATGYFPIDDMALRYLAATGRPKEHVAFVEAYARQAGLWFAPDKHPSYSKVIEIDLSEIVTSVSGPRRPQDRWAGSDTRQAMSALEEQDGKTTSAPALPRWPVAIAAITSCTNTSDPRLLIAAGIFARKARKRGLSPKPWVKTSLAPGSPAAKTFLTRAGLLEDLEALGFAIVGYGCTTCIGNSGPLTEPIQQALTNGTRAVAVLSGNRNFPGRVHFQLSEAFLASPPLVIAFALAGDVDRDILNDEIGTDQSGNPVKLADLWPTSEEIEAVLKTALNAGDFRSAFRTASANDNWNSLDAPTGPVYPWDSQSTYIRRPPFAARKSSTINWISNAVPLLALGDDITTDHISPAGKIPPESEAGSYLIERGGDPNDLNVFASRRSNWEVMVRGLFTNKSVQNLLDVSPAPGTTVHQPSGEVLPLWQAAQRYLAEKTPLIALAGERYGMGSSRDWAAKGLALLGIRALLAVSFERIHRSNLIGMGIVPLRLPASHHPSQLGLTVHDRITINGDISKIEPRSVFSVAIERANGGRQVFDVQAAVETRMEVQLLQAGGMLPFILETVGGQDGPVPIAKEI